MPMLELVRKMVAFLNIKLKIMEIKGRIQMKTKFKNKCS